MLRHAAPAAFLIACAPPPAIAVDTGGGEAPSISISYPPDGGVIALAPNCDVSFVVAVAINNLTLAEPGGDDAAGEGHWHLTFKEDGSYVPVSSTYAEITQSGFTPGSHRLRAGLQTNQHADLSEFPDWEDIVEVSLIDNETAPCVPETI